MLLRSLTELEAAALDAIAIASPHAATSLRAQAVDLEVRGRANTGEGFSTLIAIDADNYRHMLPSDRALGPVYIEVDGLAGPLVVTALFREGWLTELVGRISGGDTLGLDFDRLQPRRIFHFDVAGHEADLSLTRPVNSPLYRLQQDQAWAPFDERRAGWLGHAVDITQNNWVPMLARDLLVKTPLGLTFILTIGRPLPPRIAIGLNIIAFSMLSLPITLLWSDLGAHIPFGVLVTLLVIGAVAAFLATLRELAVAYRSAKIRAAPVDRA